MRDKRAYLTVWICLSFNFRPCLCEVQPGLPGTEVEVGKKPALSQPRHQQCLIFACFLCLSSASCPYPGLTTQFAVYILQCQMKRRDPFQTASTKHHRVPYKQETFISSSCGGWEALGQGASMVGCVFTRQKGLGSAVRWPLFYFILFYFILFY